MSGVVIILGGIILLALSGPAGSLFAARPATGQRVSTLVLAAGSALGLCGMAVAYGEPSLRMLRMPWPLPWGEFAVAADPASILFLGPVFVVPALGSFYGWGYWRAAEHPRTTRRLCTAYGLLAGGMGLVVIARDGVLFLLTWEVMALSAYFAATVEESDPEVRQAGWVYLIATHMGTLCLFALFALWNHATGAFLLTPARAVPAQTAGALFLLAVAGFGFKAGLMPLHVWLPGAHANAPSHVSAVMSGVMLKMGVYGIVRITGLIPVQAPWWGGALLCVGAVTGVAGIAYALGQRDIKRLLAYSSIENMGVIAMGLGLALLGRALDRPDWTLLGMGGALLHVWNHSLFKPLLFFGAGAVIHAARTRDMERLGGLARRMPRVAALFTVGALAICALPPFNGFASEWLLYLGFFHALDPAAGRPGAAAAVAAVALATIGALAVACFVKLLGAVFLGSPRGGTAQGAHDPRACMLGPMALLSAGCAALGLFPMAASPLLERAARAWSAHDGLGEASLAALVPFSSLCMVGLLAIGLAALLAVLLKKPLQGAGVRTAPTWDCGYARTSPRIQYTGSSFAQSLVRLFSFVLAPTCSWPSVRGLFPARDHFRSDILDMILDRCAVPLFRTSGRCFSALRIMQQGHTHLYILYIIAILLILFALGAL